MSLEADLAGYGWIAAHRKLGCRRHLSVERPKPSGDGPGGLPYNWFMILPPEASEHLPYYGKYIALVRGEDLIGALEAQIGESLAVFHGISDQKALHRYAPGKWSIKEMLGHLTDAERIFSYRALRFARNDSKPLAGFDQDPYVAAAGSDARLWSEMIAEFEHVRRASILFFRGLSPEAAMRAGVASDTRVTVRALGYIIAGHELHHLGVLRERYL
jgi:hypothetical protein